MGTADIHNRLTRLKNRPVIFGGDDRPVLFVLCFLCFVLLCCSGTVLNCPRLLGILSEGLQPAHLLLSTVPAGLLRRSAVWMLSELPDFRCSPGTTVQSTLRCSEGHIPYRMRYTWISPSGRSAGMQQKYLYYLQRMQGNDQVHGKQSHRPVSE